MESEKHEWSRRQLVKAGIAGAAGAMLGKSVLAQQGNGAHNGSTGASGAPEAKNTPDGAGDSGGASALYRGPVLDAHIHLFDTERPGGVPWPKPEDKALYQPALPPRYEAMSGKYGVVGAIAVEASPLESDNDWLLKAVESSPEMVGAIGNLHPTAPGYDQTLARLKKNPLFLGFRTGNLWKRDLLTDVKAPGFIEGLRALADAGLVLETANPDARLIGAVRLIAVRVPELRIVIDHMPNALLPEAKADLDAYWVDLHELSQRQEVYMKLSEIPKLKEDALVTDPGAYRECLDKLWDLFGEDRVIFGSDWPNSDHVTDFDKTLTIVRQYMQGKSVTAQGKYFFHNSQAAYRWKPRRDNQKN